MTRPRDPRSPPPLPKREQSEEERLGELARLLGPAALRESAAPMGVGRSQTFSNTKHPYHPDEAPLHNALSQASKEATARRNRRSAGVFLSTCANCLQRVGSNRDRSA
jgi:hypothetical protein